MPPARPPLRILLALTLCLALQMTGYLLILPLFPRRFEAFGAGVGALGISAMAYALAAMVAAPFIGTLADRFGRRPVIIASLAAYALAFAGYLFAVSAWQIIVLRGLAGLLTAGLVPAITSVVGDIAAQDRRAQWIGIVNGGASVGWIAGPALGGLLYDRFTYTVPFTAAVVMALVALLLAFFLIPETARPATSPAQPQPLSLRRLRNVPALPALSLLFVITLGVVFAWAFIEPQFMFYAYDDLLWTSSQLGLVISAYGLACTAGEFSLGRLSDRLGRKPVLLLGLLLFSAQFVGLVLFRHPVWIVASFVVAGLGNALFDPALTAHILDVTPADLTARVLGLKGTVGSLGNLLGPALVVLITPAVSPRGIFLIATALVLALILAAATALHPRPAPVLGHPPPTTP